MIVSITAMKTTDINAMIENVIQKLNSLVRKISSGEDLNAFLKNGFATEVKNYQFKYHFFTKTFLNF